MADTGIHKESVEVIDILIHRLQDTATTTSLVEGKNDQILIQPARESLSAGELIGQCSIFNGVVEMLNQYKEDVRVKVLLLSLYPEEQESHIQGNEKAHRKSFEENNVALLDGDFFPFWYNDKRLFLSLQHDEVRNLAKDFDRGGFLRPEKNKVSIPLSRILQIVIELR